ncbi:MAG: aconitase X catalytic domain-containing protein [Rhodothermales bacterium]|nr:aconitase X catalytic domain-containing protein [Rhodothermales bacterium]MBO6779259.1 aconitase X catalytic domain-containing protein [Rhodothermales bacterium]
MALTEFDLGLLNGDEGPAARMAMSILQRMLPVFGVDSFMDIEAAHIDSTVYMGVATMEYAERLAEMGARVRVPSTLNVTGVDEHGWQDWEVPENVAQNALRQMKAYASMGCIQTWTCAPYQTEHRPTFGQQIAAGESNVIGFYNSVIGARTERYPDLLDICAAITGRVPAAGLHLDEGRRGTTLLRLDAVPVALQEDPAFWPVLGHLLGRWAPDGIPVVDGLTVTPSDDDLKAVCAGAASSGAIALFHLVGITPEAPSTRDAFQAPPPAARRVSLDDLRKAYHELSTSSGSALDLVVLGSPHFSYDEFRALAGLVQGRRKADQVEFLITCSRSVRMIAEAAGLLAPIREFGARITVDTCPLTSPMLPERIKHLMTNSAKYAYYSPGLLGVTVSYGRLSDCVESAVAGRIEREEGLWRA